MLWSSARLIRHCDGRCRASLKSSWPPLAFAGAQRGCTFIWMPVVQCCTFGSRCCRRSHMPFPPAVRIFSITLRTCGHLYPRLDCTPLRTSAPRRQLGRAMVSMQLCNLQPLQRLTRSCRACLPVTCLREPVPACRHQLLHRQRLFRGGASAAPASGSSCGHRMPVLCRTHPIASAAAAVWSSEGIFGISTLYCVPLCLLVRRPAR